MQPETSVPVNPVPAADALPERLTLIEAQPLDARAAAYVQLHDELSERLAGSDAAAAHGSVN